jgi:hypothetical protein
MPQAATRPPFGETTAGWGLASAIAAQQQLGAAASSAQCGPRQPAWLLCCTVVLMLAAVPR